MLAQSQRRIELGLLVFPNFPMLAFSAFVEPFRAANLLSGLQLYRWQVVSIGPPRVQASNGLAIDAGGAVAASPHFDRVVVVSGGDADRVEAPAAEQWLRREAGRGAEIGGIADGAFFVARAGLLDGYACSIHWESESAFRERFPGAALRPELFVIDRSRFTSAGGISTFDLALELIERDRGRALATAVSDWFVHDRARPLADREAMSLRARTGLADPLMLKAIGLMEINLETPLRAAEIARALGLSRDGLERRFRAATGASPMEYYRLIRLRRARDLVRRSAMKISEIAAACGFPHAARFTQTYRRHFGLAPRDDRRQLGARAGSHSTIGLLIR